MKSSSGFGIRFISTIVGVLVLLGLIAAAPALADTISPTDGQQFSGVVDSTTSCKSTRGATATINWGDGTATSPGTISGSSVSGTHTYTEAGTFQAIPTGSGEVTVTGPNCPGTVHDPLEADVADAPLTANSLTFNATATQQFAGPVATFTDADPLGGISDYSATIDWGDGTTSSPADGQPVTISVNPGGGFAVNGTHTYATPGSYSVDVNITDIKPQGGSGGQPPSTAETFSTANVAHAPPEFTQCPPVDEDNGCGYLIVVTNGGQTADQDPSQGPYEGADDVIVGVQNNSSTPISSMPLSVPGSDLFGFDGDGICDPGGSPVPSGCVAQAGAPAGTNCQTQDAQDLYCAFPAPPGEPAGYVEPGATGTGFKENGYEGPTSWFSNVSADGSSGTVNFSPAIPPGGSTYFGLEEPPTGSTITVGGSSSVTASPPTVTAGSVTFSGSVVAGGSATTAYFEYGLDLRYTQPGRSGPNYTNKTPVQQIGSGFNQQFARASVSGLVPNALYHVRLVAANGAGTTFGPDQTFMTPALAPPGPPVLGRTFNASVVSGLVFVLLPGGHAKAAHVASHATTQPGPGYIPLTEVRSLPAGTKVDTRLGTIKIVTAAGKRKQTQTGKFGGGLFKFAQTTRGSQKGLATLTLIYGAFANSPTTAVCKPHHGKAQDASLSSRILQTLHASAHGRFRTSGRYGAATVRGTVWSITDKCNGTLFHAIVHSILIQDFVRHISFVLTAGHTYLVRAP